MLIPMKSSSLLAFMGTLSGVVGAVFMPLFGAVVDHTPHRRLLGILSAVLLVCINGVQCSISADRDWHPLAFLQVVAGWTYLVHITAKFSYLPEMEDTQQSYAQVEGAASSEPKGSVISRVTALNTGVSFLAQFAFLAFCIVLSLLVAPTFEDPTLEEVARTDVATAIISQATTALISAGLYVYVRERRERASEASSKEQARRLRDAQRATWAQKKAAGR
jgi:MFS-type transporter involved in bile tolerance (Atg22 family)